MLKDMRDLRYMSMKLTLLTLCDLKYNYTVNHSGVYQYNRI